MTLRFFALVYCATLKFAKKPLVFLLLVLLCPDFYAQSVSNEDIKKQADKLFEAEDYSKAYKLYSQLVSNFPKDPEYNYKLGVCMIYSEPDKKKSLPYLKFAVANKGDNKNLKDALFYLGKAYHINYRFDDAIKCYNDYKLNASAAQIKKYQVDREIKACSNGKHLLSNLTDLEVLSKSELSENDYFRNYKKIGGKLLVKPDDFKTSIDKKKNEKSVVFLPNGSDVVYYSSYGENAESGKDIYTTYRQANGTYSKGEKVKGINTEFDEDYPFLHPDGMTLYFASKGHNSMGGYDIFKSTFNPDTKSWSSPLNLEFPINSPDDDYLFVTDSLETMAYFSTGRQSQPGKIDVLKVKTKRKPIDIIALKGNVIQGNPEYSLKSSINVKDVLTQNEIGNFNSEEDGSYEMQLPNGGRLLFTVETPGLETQSAQVSLPVASAAKPYKQTISYEKGKLKILNYFDESANDNSYLQYLAVIEKKARLDVNDGASAAVEAPPLAAATTNPEATKSTSPETNEPVSTSAPSIPDPKKGMNNKELATLAKEDASELKQEAAQLNRDYLAANETGLKQKAEADKKAVEASDALFKAETISDEAEKKSAIENANALKISAEKDQAVADKILKLAESLNADSKAKSKEASLNSEYAKELEKSMNPKDNKASQAKLEDLQKQINGLSGKKNESDNVVTEIKTEIEQKEKQIEETEKINTGIKTNLDEIKTLIADKETELGKTKKKAAKKEISTEIDGLKVEQVEKEKQITENDTEIKALNEELVSIKNELDLATKITSENIDVKAAAAEASLSLTNGGLKEKYKDKTAITDSQSRSNVEESTVQLNSYNRELDLLIAKNKTELAKTKNKEAKLKISTEIRQLEDSKKQNQVQITGNNKKLQELNAAPVKSTEVVKNTFDPIVAESPADAVTKLDQLNTQLNVNDNENFDYNGYQNPQAQSLKIEADAKINDAIAKQKKLKDEIAISKEDIKKSGPVVSSQQLNKEAEDLLSQSQKIRDDAQTKKGSEKTKLLEDAKKLDEQANTKYIDAAEVTRADNASIVSANQENIQNLINDNKAPEADITIAKSLNEEAKLAFRKAADIRIEGNSLSNAGGKLGSFSNAEEKEAEAILKQQQAIDILAKSDPDLKLKVPITSTTTAGNNTASSTVDLSSKLQTVNTELTDLAAIKTESYQKLNEANEAEIAQLLSDIKDNQSVIDNTPSLKTDFISGNNKVATARSLKQTSDNASNPGEKLNSLIASIKKQNEAIKQLSSVNAAILKTAGSKASEPVVTNPPVEQTNLPKENPVVTEVTPTEPTTNPVKETPPATDNELNMLSEINTEKLDISQLAQKDTTAGQMINYFDNTITILRSSQAASTVKASLGQLKELEGQSLNLDAALEKTANNTSASAPALNPKELTTKADALMNEADELADDAQDLKKQAQGKEGAEKTDIQAQAKELETQSQDKMIEAANYIQQANETVYKTNINSVTELIAKLKTDNPEMAADVESRREELAPLKIQISNLRAEANALNNKAAKIGAMSNAEEKEIELIQKQNVLLTELKKKYPDYQETPYVAKSSGDETADLQQKKSELREKQYAELINLTNAFSLEYESSKNSVPSTLTADQQSVKQNAEELNSESKRLLIKASQEKNDNEKIKLLTLAAKSGGAAIEKLYMILPKSNQPKNDLEELASIGSDLVNSNANNSNTNEDEPVNPRNNKPAATTNTAAKTSRGTIKIDGLEVVQGNAYSTSNPIPMDARMEDGLVFRVQIGAFKTPLPNNAFKGLSPLNGETTNSGYIRYTAGNFFKIENANAVKNDLRNLGYSDAFVVVYFNGKRITLAEALAEMERQGKTVDATAPQTAGITSNVNVPKAAVNTAIQEAVTITKELEQIDGLLYTIQIGVYTKQVSKPQILNLKPIFREQLTNGLYRYTAGIYNNPEKILLDKARVVDMGIRDAFVSAYLNGKRIPFNEARERQTKGDPTLKLETQNPIVFPDRTAERNPEASAPNPFDALLSTPVSVEPFKNSVTNYPASTPENGVKANEQGVTFKVQIGAFSKQVPEDVAAKFSSIRSWPVDNKQINGLFIYNIGNFSDAKFAKNLRDEAIRLGITDAFITVYRDGKKIYGPEAENLMR